MLLVDVDVVYNGIVYQYLHGLIRKQLVFYASETALFQAMLAHAAYTAAPPVVWPDSPAAEAIANADPAVS